MRRAGRLASARGAPDGRGCRWCRDPCGRRTPCRKLGCDPVRCTLSAAAAVLPRRLREENARGGVPRRVGQAATSRRAADASGRKVLYWYDPMAPGSKFDKPGKSPFMDMELVPKYADEPARPAAGVGRVGHALAGGDPRDGVAVAPVLRETPSRGIRAVGSIEVDETRQARVAARVRGAHREAVRRLHRTVGEGGAPLYALYSPELVATQREYVLALENWQRLAGGTDAVRSADELVAAARERLASGGRPSQIARSRRTAARRRR